MALSIVEHNWALIPVPKNPDIQEAQHLTGDGDGNKNHFIRHHQPLASGSIDPGVVLNLSTRNTVGTNRPEYYIYDRYARLVKL